jgi:hypothetical protein
MRDLRDAIAYWASALVAALGALWFVVESFWWLAGYFTTLGGR